MLNNGQKTLLQKPGATLSREQWLSAKAKARAETGRAAVTEKGKLHIFFATETGNSKTVAQQLLKQAKAAGWRTAIASVSQVTPETLAALDGPAIFIAATHGEGDPPESAVKYYTALQAAEGNILKELRYALLGLGDSAYAQFCGFARKLDQELARLGAMSLLPRKELDVDFSSHISGWITEIINALPVTDRSGEPTYISVDSSEEQEDVLFSGKGYSRLDPVIGRVSEIVNLNDTGSNKETYHIEMICDALPRYRPGDAAGIIIPGEKDALPRLYSIASSPAVHKNSLHLTVALAWHTTPDGKKGFGLCSRYLAHLKPGDEVQFYIHQNSLFRLPPDECDIIMIGPGTGIAPFRSFVLERTERGAQGRNWLFFGEQHAHLDFLYQQEWINLAESEALHRIDLAFSRDQEQKVYVQHCLRKRAAELVEWLEGGAYLYVCGRKDPMSRDVDDALLEIIAAHKDSAAGDYLARLSEEGRYIKDVY